MSKKKRSRKKRTNTSSRRESTNKPAQVAEAPETRTAPPSSSSSPSLWLVAISCAAIALLYFATRPSSDPTVEAESPPQVANSSDGKTGNSAANVAANTQAAIQLPTAPGLEKQRFDSVVRGVAEREDPVLDGWDSERFNEIAGKQLKLVGKLLSKGSVQERDLKNLVDESFQSNGLRPQTLTQAYQDSSISVLRGSTESNEELNGWDGFSQAVVSQREPLTGLAGHHFKFKIIRVQQSEDHTDTTAYFQIDARNSNTSKQINSTWNCRWTAGSDPEHPLLGKIEVTDYEEVTYTSDTSTEPSPDSGPMFVDCTESIFRNSDRFRRQLIYGIDHWTDQFDGAIARPAAGHGIAIGDVNGDNLDDVYLCQSPALPNLLLIQNPDGTVRDTAVEAGVNWLEGTRAALLADLDNDGDQDLVAVLGSKVVVQSNDGTGKFSTATIISTPSSLFQINAVDYDNDADLDLFICGYTLSGGVDATDVFANPMPFHDANNGAPNVLLKNDGSWAFHDVTNQVGLNQNNRRFSYASAWDDYDGDGDLDVYIANDFGRNNLYRNDNGHFTDVAEDLNVEDIGPGMSASWGDFNNDGRPDIYVSNMFSSAGNRITHQQQFKTGLDEQTKQHFQRHARGNSLFENLGNGTFSDRSVDLGVTLGRWAWGSLFVDLNNDGWEDLYVANGFITADNNNDL